MAQNGQTDRTRRTVLKRTLLGGGLFLGTARPVAAHHKPGHAPPGGGPPDHAGPPGRDDGEDDDGDGSDGNGDGDGDGDGDGGTHDGRGYLWGQTHTDVSWLHDADAADTLTVETVTNLDVAGDGSLAAALAAAEDNDATLIVFEVGGVIDWGGETYLRSYPDNVFIAGQTAPYPGVTLAHGGLRIHGDNTIIQHMAFLCGDDVAEPHKAGAVTYDDGVENALLDHCLAGWAPDTNLRVRTAATNPAFINGINAEALNDSSHPEAPHGYGINVSDDTTGLSYLGNLQAHNWRRNLKPNPGVDIAFINNYIYNWGQRVQHGDAPTSAIDWIGDVVEAGADTTRLELENDGDGGVFSNDAATVYWDDVELIPADTPLSDDNIEYVDRPMTLPDGLALADIVPAAELADFIAATAGPRPADRDPTTQRLIDDFLNKTGGIIDHQDEVGGYPDYAPSERALSPPDTDVLDWLGAYTDEVELGADNPHH